MSNQPQLLTLKRLPFLAPSEWSLRFKVGRKLSGSMSCLHMCILHLESEEVCGRVAPPPQPPPLRPLFPLSYWTFIGHYRQLSWDSSHYSQESDSWIVPLSDLHPGHAFDATVNNVAKAKRADDMITTTQSLKLIEVFGHGSLLLLSIFNMRLRM
ncbi:hemocyanin 1 [Biomphalaria glabrata]|nr:hemocyanin 1 [Biomphalaria glabrata]